MDHQIMAIDRKPGATRYWWVALLGVPLVLALLMLAARKREAQILRLPDGTEFRLALVAYTNSYSYTQLRGPAWLQKISRLIPDVIERRFITRGGTIGMGSTPETNLMVVVEVRNRALHVKDHPIRLRVRDESGNSFDGNSRAGTLSTGTPSSGGEKAIVWIVAVMPIRSKQIYLEPLVQLPDGAWTNLGPFATRNPRFGDYPQWKAQPIPQTMTDGEVTATLEHLRSGSPTSTGTREVPWSDSAPQSTTMEFSFAESGRRVDHFRIHRLTLSDATGNQWSPYLSAFNQSGQNWTTNGVAEFIGALWPGEDAWKIELQSLRTAEFESDELWTLPPLPLPNPQTHHEFTERFQLGPLSIHLANFTAPGVQLSNSWQWIVRYWGQEPSVYGLGVKFEGAMEDRRLVVVNATDQNTNGFRIVEHRGADYPEQALFLQPPSGATELRLKLAFPVLKRFEFLARPEFAGPPKDGPERRPP